MMRITEHTTARWRVRRLSVPFRGDPAFVLLAAMLCVLWVAGGASREDATGQVVVRTSAWGSLIVTVLFGRRPSLHGLRPVAALLGAAILLPLLQLVPLPPALWQALPGRGVLAQAASAGAPQPWRPLSLVPGATANAAASLVVPTVILLLLAQLRVGAREEIPGLVLGLLVGSTVLALMQFSVGGLDNPLINDRPGQVSGPLANRNHFALLMAMGCVVAPVWAFLGDRGMTWRAPFAFGLVLLFMLTSLGSGSRAGLLIGAVGLCLGFGLIRGEVRRILRWHPRWISPAVQAGIVGVIAVIVFASVVVDRAVSINRVLVDSGGQDMRRRALPTVLDMASEYFPAGSGLGSFDPVFRLHEPFDMLKLTFFNHAHNDFLEVVLDTGLAGVLLLLAALVWWVWASMRAWRAGRRVDAALPRVGSAILLLVVVASLFDYPARTPLIMAMVIIAAAWLSAGTTLGHRRPDDAGADHPGAALPQRDQHL